MWNGRITELQWPNFNPENCPPEEAEPVSETTYRLVQQDPTQPKDFIPLYIDRPENFENKSTSEVCRGCGVKAFKYVQYTQYP